MTTSVLEFKLFDELFCLNTNNIDYVFELENFTELKIFHESVIGLTKYNRDVMILIDAAILYSKNSLDLSKPKSVIVIKDSNRNHYGLVVDEIIKIEDVEIAISGAKLSTKETTINHYKAKDMIVNEIDPFPILQKYNIPAMNKSTKIDFDSKAKNNKSQKEYLLFEIGENLYALETEYVKEVIESSASGYFSLDTDSDRIKGAFAVREEIIKIVKLDSPKNPQEIVITEAGDRIFGIETDKINDIKNFNDAKLELIEDKEHYIKAFYNYDKRVVAIINPNYFVKESKQKKRNSEKREQLQNSKKRSFLIFTIDDKRFAISMESVRRVSETQTLPKTKSSSAITGKNTKFITTWNNTAVSIILLDKFLNITSKEDDSQAIFAEHEDNLVAFVIDDIEDIVLIDISDINSSKDDETNLIDGAVIYKDIAIPKINEKNLVKIR